jgi:hypothetical protein
MSNDKPKLGHGGHRPGAGRKPLDPTEPTMPVQVRLTASQREKLKRLGGPAWIRCKIDKAKEPV